MNNAIKAGLIFAVCLLSGCDAQSLTGNSGLTNCRICGGMVAVEAKACPHCGAPDPAPRPTVAENIREGGRIYNKRAREEAASGMHDAPVEGQAFETPLEERLPSELTPAEMRQLEDKYKR